MSEQLNIGTTSPVTSGDKAKQEKISKEDVINVYCCDGDFGDRFVRAVVEEIYGKDKSMFSKDESGVICKRLDEICGKIEANAFEETPANYPEDPDPVESDDDDIGRKIHLECLKKGSLLSAKAVDSLDKAIRRTVDILDCGKTASKRDIEEFQCVFAVLLYPDRDKDGVMANLNYLLSDRVINILTDEQKEYLMKF